MIEVDPRALEAFCEELEIIDKETGDVVPFVLNDEQREVVRVVCARQRVIILKARQVGISTILLAYDLLFAIANPRAPVTIALDSDDNAKALLGKVRQWCEDKGIPLLVKDAHRLVLANGSTIKTSTSGSRAAEGQSRTARSGSSALVHASELAFWVNADKAFQSLAATALKTAKIIIESTGSPGAKLFRTLWDRAVSMVGSPSPRAYAPVFLSVEMQRTYRSPPETITDEHWETYQKRGFSLREAAAWWHETLESDYAGDLYGCLQEFPIKPEDAFSVVKGRWIFRHTKVEPVRVSGDWRLYSLESAEPLIMACDVAKGVGLDSSAIALVEQGSGHLVATFKSNTIDVVAFAETIREAHRTFKPTTTIIETNGIGAGVYSLCASWALDGLLEQTSSRNLGEKDVRMRWVKREIEKGTVRAGAELDEEVVGSLRTEEGDWIGPDDLLNALSFALKYREANPWYPPRAKVDYHERYAPPGAPGTLRDLKPKPVVY